MPAITAEYQITIKLGRKGAKQQSIALGAQPLLPFRPAKLRRPVYPVEAEHQAAIHPWNMACRQADWRDHWRSQQAGW